MKSACPFCVRLEAGGEHAGEVRILLAAVRDGLLEMQRGRCFYWRNKQVYFGLPDGTPLWVASDRFKESRQSVFRRVLG